MRGRLRFPLLFALVPAALALASPAARAAAPPMWAPAATAAVHPGSQTYTQSSQCTANFVYVDGVNVYLGQAAHCSSTGTNGDTNGCTTRSLPIGTPVRIVGATKPGILVYNSWLAMQAVGEKDANTCAYNDLALVRIDPADLAAVNPSIPAWGGPVGLNTAGTTQGDAVYSYGHSSLLLGLGALGPRQGQSRGDQGGGWSHIVLEYPAPGIPGDSGSAFLDSQGNALGVLSTIDVGTDFSNGVGDLSRELAYLHTHSALTAVHLALGTEPFKQK
ncbi:MAG TPA: serine protease [Candidatus Dormibacteraeota bacterium]|jgi:hypothetical protein|nr:serine protease [Candidatus Dormibacteraeota bacterium]